MKLFLSLFLLSHLAIAQETIQTGRPGQSIGVAIVGQNYFQIQSGFDSVFYKQNGEKRTDQVNNNVFRTGYSKGIELSAVYDTVKLDSQSWRGQNLQVGARFRLVTSDKITSSFQSRWQAVDNNAKATNSLKTVNILATNYDLGEYGSVTNNLIFSNLADSADFNGALTLAYGFNLSENLSAFIEYYGNESDEAWIGAWDSGLGFLVNKDLLLDISFGYDLSPDIDSRFVSFGFSYRF